MKLITRILDMYVTHRYVKGCLRITSSRPVTKNRSLETLYENVTTV